MEIPELVEKQRAFFQTGVTLPIEYRKKALQILKDKLQQREKQLLDAVYQDLRKAPMETYITEMLLIYEEINTMLKKIKLYAKKRRVASSLFQFPAKSYLIQEPYGIVGIISPWNYPILLCLQPLVGAIAAGNCVVLKPSEHSPNTSRVLGEIIEECFQPEYIHVVQGGKEEANLLLEQALDNIFFTGSTRVGKIIMEKAAKQLIPVTLELGGKSPCIVEKSADIPLAAKRIVFGKLLAAGQTCVAPDYVLVERDVKEKLIHEIKKNCLQWLGENPLEKDDYPTIVNEQNLERLASLLQGQKILYGGNRDRKTRRMQLTLVETQEDSNIMKEEIFGPILPIITVDSIEQVISNLSAKEKPLALYLFTKNKRIEQKVIASLSYGGACINDTIIQLANSRLPFGGIGKSGMGKYHGEYSFHTFSHEKAVVKRANIFDLPIRYRPYTKKKWNQIKKLFCR